MTSTSGKVLIITREATSGYFKANSMVGAGVSVPFDHIQYSPMLMGT